MMIATSLVGGGGVSAASDSRAVASPQPTSASVIRTTARWRGRITCLRGSCALPLCRTPSSRNRFPVRERADPAWTVAVRPSERRSSCATSTPGTCRAIRGSGGLSEPAAPDAHRMGTAREFAELGGSPIRQNGQELIGGGPTCAALAGYSWASDWSLAGISTKAISELTKPDRLGQLDR
jgi:hypothetical protein